MPSANARTGDLMIVPASALATAREQLLTAWSEGMLGGVGLAAALWLAATGNWLLFF